MKENRAINWLTKLLFVIIIGFLVITAVLIVLGNYILNNMGADETHTNGGVEVVGTPFPTP